MFDFGDEAVRQITMEVAILTDGADETRCMYDQLALPFICILHENDG